MIDWQQEVDLDRYVRSRVQITNADGGRGYENGVRVFNCPHCDDQKARGFANVSLWSAGCLNSGCEANPRMSGVIEWAQKLEGFVTRGRVWALLRSEFKGSPAPQAAIRRAPVEDFCRFPPSTPMLEAPVGILSGWAFRFIHMQWGLPSHQAPRWGLRVCLTGPHAWRIVIPIVADGAPVAFQSRSFRNGEPKYLASKSGLPGDPEAECGRPIGDCLFNLDALPEGGTALLLEGCGDVFGWEARRLEDSGAGDLRGVQPLTPLGIMGTALTPARMALLAQKRPGQVIVALDAEPAAQARAPLHVEDLRAWGLPALRGSWSGGKDAGSGARLTIEPEGSLSDRLRARLGSPRTL